MNGPGSIRIEERGPRASSFGEVMQLRVSAPGGRPLFWREIADAFNEAYPGRYAVQLFPPSVNIVDGSNKYHLWMLPEPPRGLDLREGERPTLPLPPPATARAGAPVAPEEAPPC